MKPSRKSKAIHNKLLPHTPEVHEEENQTYVDELIGFIDNPKTNNIALMGDYGTGKSSILEQLKYELKQSKCQWCRRDAIKTVSFLSFRVDDSKNESESEDETSHVDVELNKDGSGSNNPKSSESRRLRSSMQSEFVRQLFYSVPPNKLRGSHYSRVGRTSPIFLKALVIAVYAVILMCISGDVHRHIHTCIDMMPAFVMVMLVYMIAYVIIISIADYLCEHPPKSFGISGVEVALTDDNDNDLEQLLDEIIYFFNKTGCRVLIIEDIDRFNNLEIYEDLRDLNVILNSTRNRKLTKKITFIYAMRPSLLPNIEQRSKLFDAAVSVIPFISVETVENYVDATLSSMIWADDCAFDQIEIKHIARFISSQTVDMRSIVSISNGISVAIELFSRKGAWGEYKPLYVATSVMIREFYPELYSLMLAGRTNVFDNAYGRCAERKQAEYQRLERNYELRRNLIGHLIPLTSDLIKKLKDDYSAQFYSPSIITSDGETISLTAESYEQMWSDLLSNGLLKMQIGQSYQRKTINVSLEDVKQVNDRVAELCGLAEHATNYYKDARDKVHALSAWSYLDDLLIKDLIARVDENAKQEAIDRLCKFLSKLNECGLLCEEYRMYLAPVGVNNSNARVSEFVVRFLRPELPSYGYYLDDDEVKKVIGMTDSQARLSKAMFNYSIFGYLLCNATDEAVSELTKKYADSKEYAEFLIGYISSECEVDTNNLNDIISSGIVLSDDNKAVSLAVMLAMALLGDNNVSTMVHELKDASEHKFWLAVLIAYINIAKDESYAAIGGAVRNLAESGIAAISNNNLGNKLANIQKSIGMKTRQLSSFLPKSDIDKIVELWNFELSKENLGFVNPGVLTNVLATGVVSTDDMKFILLNGSGSQKNVVLTRVFAVWNANQNALDGELAHCAVSALRDDGAYQGMNPAFIASLLEQYASAGDAQIILPKYIDSLDDSDVLRAIKGQYRAVLDTNAPYVRIQAHDGWRSILDKLKAMGYINRYEDMGDGKIHVVPTKHKNEV